MAQYKITKAEALTGLSAGVYGVTDLTGYSCILVVRDLIDRTVKIQKDVEASAGVFASSLSPTETNSLAAGEYNIIFQIENESLSFNDEQWHLLRVLPDGVDPEDLVPDPDDYDYLHTHENKTTLDAITAAFTTALKSKLDGIETGATADQTKSDIDALGLSHDSLTNVSADDHHAQVHTLSSHTAREIVNLTDLTLSVLASHHLKAIDCYNAGTQTLTFAALAVADDGKEWVITKMGDGNVTIVAPSGVTFGGGDSSITLVTQGYECRIRYNHTRLMFTLMYNGEII